MKVIPWMDSTVQGNDFELIPTIGMERGHSVEGSFSCEFSSIYIVRELWASEFGSRLRRYRKTCVFGKNDPLWEDFPNFVRRGFIISQIHILCANFVKFGWPGIGKVVRYLPVSVCCLALASSQIGLKICQGQRQTMYSQCPKFHPNRFTSGGVLAKCVNTIQTLHKVFPILDEASASSPSKKQTT